MSYMDGQMPRTMAVRRALQQSADHRGMADLLFLEAWEAQPQGDIASTLRIHQIRRANPELAAAIRAELASPARAVRPDVAPAQSNASTI